MKSKTATPADENIGAVVRMLLAAKRGTPDDVASALGIHRSSLFEKMNGNRRWHASEVQTLSHLFGVPIATFYGGSSALLPTSCDYRRSSDQLALFNYALAS